MARCNSADSSQRGILLLVRLQGMQKSHKAQCSEAVSRAAFQGIGLLPTPPNGCPAATPDRSQQGIGYLGPMMTRVFQEFSMSSVFVPGQQVIETGAWVGGALPRRLERLCGIASILSAICRRPRL